jgi:hypothetical protein
MLAKEGLADSARRRVDDVGSDFVSDHWLGRLLEDEGVDNDASLERFLADEHATDRVLAVAEAVQESPQLALPPERGSNDLVAGASLDLSGHLDLWILEGKKAQLDSLFRRVWHYFDRVVVTGPLAADYVSLRDGSDRSHGSLMEHLRADAGLLLYVKESGLSDLLVFRDKPHASADFFRDHDLISKLRPAVEGVVQDIVTEGSVEFSDHGDHHHYTLNHPMLEHTQWGSVDAQHAKEFHSSLEEAAAWAVVSRFLDHLGADLRSSHLCNASLGSTIRMHGRMLRQLEAGPAREDIAFNLHLPVIDDIPIAELVDLRRKEQDRFVLFRQALSEAIRERSVVAEGTSASDVAEEIERDVIQPALAAIRLRLTETVNVLNRRHYMSAAVAAFGTVCGALGVDPLAVGATVTAIAGGSASEVKAIEDRAEVARDPMYFLWQASQASRKRKV